MKSFVIINQIIFYIYFFCFFNFQEIIRKKSADLVKQDQGFKVDIQFWLSSVGETGNQILLDKWADTLPTAEKAMDIATSIQLQKKLLTSGIFAFSNAATQEICKDCFANLKLMLAGQPPKINRSATSEAKKFYASLACFCRDEVEGTAVIGQQAFAEKLKNLDKVQNFEQLDQFMVFSWLANFFEQRKIQEKKNALIAKLDKETSEEAVAEAAVEALPLHSAATGSEAKASFQHLYIYIYILKTYINIYISISIYV